MSHTKAKLALLSLFLSSVAYSAAFAQSDTDQQRVTVRTELVNVNVMAREKKTGRIISSLAIEDFNLYEDGVQQMISYFSQDPLPLSILLLVDRAGCINAFNDEVRAATIKAFGNLKPEDEVGVMTFSSKVHLTQPFTRDRQLLADQIIAVEQQHHTEQHFFNAAIYQAATYMRKAANPGGRRVILVLTGLEASIDFSRTSQKEALEALLESGAAVSGVLVKTIGGRIEQGIRGKPTSILRHIGLRAGSLKVFVTETGGELIGSAPDKIEDSLTGVMSNIASSYSLAYLPTNSTRDGKRRRIGVQLSPVVAQREGPMVVLSRKSYVMPKDGN